MPYIAVIAGLIHTMQFIYQGMWLQFLTKDLATDLISKTCFYDNHDICMPSFEEDSTYCFVYVCWLVCIPW